MDGNWYLIILGATVIHLLQKIQKEKCINFPLIRPGYVLLKYFFILIIFFSICSVNDCFAEQIEIGSGDITTIKVHAYVRNAEDYGITQEEFEMGYEIYSVMWIGKQCCLQKNSKYGVFSDYCFTEKAQEQLNYCEAYLN